jgi:hypothetical protein
MLSFNRLNIRDNALLYKYFFYKLRNKTIKFNLFVKNLKISPRRSGSQPPSKDPWPPKTLKFIETQNH